MAQARIWNATPYPISVKYQDYNWDFIQRKYIRASQGTRNIQPFTFLAYDNFTSYLEITVKGQKAPMIPFKDSYQYVVTAELVELEEKYSLSDKYTLLDTTPNTLMDAAKRKYKDGLYLKTWMTDSWNLINHLPIWDVVLPGSHDSGSYDPVNTGYVRNQTFDIEGQLDRGIRCFDIRVKKRDNGEYVMAHGTYPFKFLDDKVQSFNEAVDQILAFAEANPKEIVVLQIKGDFGTNQQEYIDFQDSYLRTLKNQAVILDVPVGAQNISAQDYTLNAIAQTGRNLVIISPHGEQPTIVPPAIAGRSRFFQWKSMHIRNTPILTSSWDNKQTFKGVGCDLTPQQKIKFLKDHIPNWLKGNRSYPGNKSNGGSECGPDNPSSEWQYVQGLFTKTAASIWTPSIIGDTVNLLQPFIVDLISDWGQDSQLMKNLNIISLDAVYSSFSNPIGTWPVNVHLIPEIIKLNKYK